MPNLTQDQSVTCPPSGQRRRRNDKIRAYRRSAALMSSHLWATTVRPWLEYTVRFAFAIAAAVIVPIVLQSNSPSGPALPWGNRFFGGLVFLVGLVLGNTLELKILANRSSSRDADLLATLSRDNDLRRCLDGLDQVSRQDESHLLERLLSKAAHELGNSIATVAGTLEYELQPRIDETDIMLRCSEGEPMRAVHYLDNTPFLIENQHSIEFWMNLDEEVSTTKTIPTVQRCFW